MSVENLSTIIISIIIFGVIMSYYFFWKNLSSRNNKENLPNSDDYLKELGFEYDEDLDFYRKDGRLFELIDIDDDDKGFYFKEIIHVRKD